MNKLKIEYVSPISLKPAENNPRIHSKEQLEIVGDSIKEFGFLVPIVVDKNNYIIAGHARHIAAKERGMIEVPIIKAEHLTEKQIETFKVLDNKSVMMADWDDPKLMGILESLKDDPELLRLTGFEDKEISQLADKLREPTDEDEVPPPPKVAKSKRGEVWLLGKHRVMCGDSTNAEDVKILMGGGKADMVFTDPPYGVSYSKDNKPTYKEWNGIENDDLTGEDLKLFLKKAFNNLMQFTQEEAPFYIWSAPLQDGISSFKACQDSGILIQSQLIWKKNHFAMARNDYHWIHEICWYGYKEKKKHSWYGGRDKKTVWEITKDASGNYEHPTQKPIELSKVAVQNSSQIGQIVLDLFLGSGSTLIACEQTDRICYGMEIDPIYIDVILQRWAKFTGKDPIRESDQKKWSELKNDD